MSKPRYCGTCGYTQPHRQVESGGMIVEQCMFCHADREYKLEMDKRMRKLKNLSMWLKASLN